MIFNITRRNMLFACLVCFVFSGSAQSQGTTNPILAQKIVDDAHAKHSEAFEIEIATVGAHGCSTIASTNRNDIGEKCEKDDSEPMHTGKPFVEKEKSRFDVSLPLHDMSGKLIGSVGIEIAPKAGQTEEVAIQKAQTIAGEIEKGIPSKSSLTQPF